MAEIADEFGYDAILTRGNHIKFTHRITGKVVFAASTPSDNRAIHNVRADLRRWGK